MNAALGDQACGGKSQKYKNRESQGRSASLLAVSTQGDHQESSTFGSRDHLQSDSLFAFPQPLTPHSFT
jgi:hypothetical protein